MLAAMVTIFTRVLVILTLTNIGYINRTSDSYINRTAISIGPQTAITTRPQTVLVSYCSKENVQL